MKTAKIEVHPVFGTWLYCGQVFYRGKELWSTWNSKDQLTTAQSHLDACRTWAKQNGFSHVNVTFG